MSHPAPPLAAPNARGRLGGLALLSLPMLAVAWHVAGSWLGPLPWWPADVTAPDAAWVALVLVYIVAMALPFVPGIEIGLALMLLLGKEGIVLVYLCTQLALALSFACGRLLPPAAAVRWLHALRLDTVARWWARLDATDAARRIDGLAQREAPRWCRSVLAHRHMGLALAINLPGNALIGGAGGIGWIAGASRLFSGPRYALTVALATSPLPLLLLLGGVA